MIMTLFIKIMTWPFRALFSKRGAGGLVGYIAMTFLVGFVLLFVKVVVLAAYGQGALQSVNQYTAYFWAFWYLGVPSLVLLKKLNDGYKWIREEKARSGRERYQTGWLDVVRAVFENPDVPTDSIYAHGADGPVTPHFDEETSTFAIGQTGTGKSTFVKSRVGAWDFEGAVIAHAIGTPDGDNEFVDFFEDLDQDVQVMSSQNPDLRWDPMLDFDATMQDMENLAEGVFETREIKETGWTDPARSLLVAALAVTKGRHNDMAQLPDVLAEGPEYIIEECENVPDAQLTRATLTALDGSELKTIYTTLLNQLRPLLRSSIFDEDVPRASLREYLEDPGDNTLVLNNVRSDRYARGFWRFMIQSAVDMGFETEGSQQFLLDEVDKLPRIDNLDELVSAGRSASLTAVVVCQDRRQIEEVYGDLSASIWSNSPNRVCFRCGDEDTAELALSSIGDVELEAMRVSDDTEMGHDDERRSKGIDEGKPLLPSDLTSLDVGEALIQSANGWWLVKLTEPNLGDGGSRFARVRSSIPGSLIGSRSSGGDDVGA